MTAIDIDSLQATNFEFDIEANRRRRAELANDVTELISISKFFLQHYSSDSPDDLPPIPQKTKHPAITKREKNETNVNKAGGRSVGRNAQTKRSPVVAIATPTHVKRKQTRMNNGRVNRMRGNDDDDVPPLFDKIKLHEYCVDIVDRFFHGPPPNESEISESPKNPPPPPSTTTIKKSQSTEKSIQTTNYSGTNEIILSKPRKNSKYATVASRYMNQMPQKSINESVPSKNNLQHRLVSAKSREILEEVARKGTEIKRHSCLIHKRDRSVLHHDSTPQDGNRSQIRFRDVHPTIELVPSNTIFPKRILKQSSESQEPSSAEQKTDEEEHKAKHESSVVSPVKSNLSTNTMIEIKGSAENDRDQGLLKDNYQLKGELKMQQLPVLSIKPQTKCEIENIYEIEIKPDEAKSGAFLSKDKNKVIQFVYESSEQDVLQQNEMHSNQCQNSTNKYIAPFVDEIRVAERLSGENNTTDETHETSHLSLNLSTSSHLTDDEKSQSDKKGAIGTSKEFKHVPKTQAKSVIDKILEIEGVASEQTTSSGEELKATPVKIQPKVPQQSQSFDDLREILRKIRNDKTTLDVALDTIKPPDLMSPARVMTDREVQCDDLTKNDTPKSEATQKLPTKYSARNVGQIHSPHYIDSSIIDSPKFHKTIESIRSSARRLDFSINDSEYRSATRQQIEKAAKKFLKSILKNADAALPIGASEREDNSQIHMKIDKQNYKIVDDQIIQSNFNVKSYHGDCTTSTSSDASSLQLRLPSARILTNRNRIKCDNWIDRTNSDFTSNSIDKYINNYRLNDKLPQQSLMPNTNNNYSDLSDGEILSDGEFHIP